MVEGRGTRDDVVLTTAQREALLGEEVVVEEKLDGANVSCWVEGGRVLCASRAGLHGRDRSGQIGALKGWVASNHDRLLQVLGSAVLYAEWLFLTHTLAYDRLPDYFVGIDFWEPQRGFLPPEERTHRLLGGGLLAPPEVARGRFASTGAVERLLGQSRYGPDPMEGLIIRSQDGEAPRLAKLLRPGFTRLDDSDWNHGRPRNQLA